MHPQFSRLFAPWFAWLFLSAAGLIVAVIVLAVTAYAYIPQNIPGPKGDVNLDGVPASADAMLILQYVSGLTTFSPLQRDLADANEDNQVTSADALKVLRWVSGLDPLAISGQDANVQTTLNLIPNMILRGASTRLPLLFWYSSHGMTPSGWQPFGDRAVAFWTSHDNGVPANLIVLPFGQIYSTVAHEVMHAYSGHWDTFSGAANYEGAVGGEMISTPMEDFAITGSECYGRPPGTALPDRPRHWAWFTARFGLCH